MLSVLPIVRRLINLTYNINGMPPKIGQKVVYIHGRTSGPAPGLPGITIGKEYTVERTSRIRDTWWVRITDDNGNPVEVDYVIFQYSKRNA